MKKKEGDSVSRQTRVSTPFSSASSSILLLPPIQDEMECVLCVLHRGVCVSCISSSV